MVKNLKIKTCFTLRCLFFTFIWSNFINGQSDLKFSEVVRLNPVYLSKDKINDITAIKGLLREFCNTQGIDAIDSLEKLYNFELGDVQIEKLFPWLGTNDTLSIGRQGQKVEMPPFWATFSFNYNTDAQQMEFSKILKRCYPFVIYNHPFFEVDYQTNDPYFSEQLGLKNDNNSFADINIEEAWEIESGKSFIKVGVFDSGVDAHHEDINLLTGCHCYENTGIGSYNFGIDKLGHGTSVAGIIGANSNNSIGIAGIAGVVSVAGTAGTAAVLTKVGATWVILLLLPTTDS